MWSGMGFWSNINHNNDEMIEISFIWIIILLIHEWKNSDWGALVHPSGHFHKVSSLTVWT